jgi:hypothetical protein
LRADVRKYVSMGDDPISFLCGVLADEDAPIELRREAAQTLLPYYHPRLARMGPLLEKFAK